jgi:hypothetical protein
MKEVEDVMILRTVMFLLMPRLLYYNALFHYSHPSLYWYGLWFNLNPYLKIILIHHKYFVRLNSICIGF